MAGGQHSCWAVITTTTESAYLEVSVVIVGERVSKLRVESNVSVSCRHRADKSVDRVVQFDVGGVDVLVKLRSVVIHIEDFNVHTDRLRPRTVQTRVGGHGIKTV